MKKIIAIILLTAVMSGCDGISNGSEIREQYERCIAIYDACSVVLVPDAWDFEAWIDENKPPLDDGDQGA